MPHYTSIFIADDNKINRLLLQSQLESFCHNITLAADGKIALNYLQQHKYDLILLDIQMPYYSGLELVKIIKKTGSINQKSPVIAITAQIQSAEQKALIESEFDECLIKPILLEQLDRVVTLLKPTPPSINIDNSLNTATLDYVALLLQRTSGNTTLATTIFHKLFSELPEQCTLISEALLSNNLSMAQEITHKLHGSVSFCGFSDIQAFANALETSLLEKNTILSLSNFNLLDNKIALFLNKKEAIFRQLNNQHN